MYFSAMGSSKVDAAAPQFPVAEAGRLRSLAAAYLAWRLRRLRWRSGRQLGNGVLIIVVRHHRVKLCQKRLQKSCGSPGLTARFAGLIDEV